MQGESLNELRAGAQQAVELGTLGQGREGVSEVACSVAIEVPLAVETAPTREDGEGEDLTFAEGGIGTGLPFWWLGVAKVVNHNVECGEEGCDTKSLERSSSKWTWDSVRSHRHRHMRDRKRTGVKLPVMSKRIPNRAEEPGLGEGRTGERRVNLCKRRHRKIAETRSTRRHRIIIGPGTPSCPGMNTEGPGVKKAPTPTVSPSCGTCKPRWGLWGKPTVSRLRGRPKYPAGGGRIE
jgi:hypothetical protein